MATVSLTYGNAEAFRHSHSSMGAPVHWDRAVLLDLDLGNSPASVSPEQSVVAVDQAFSHWLPHLPELLTVAYSVSAEVPLSIDGRDQLNVIRWSDEDVDSGALATTYVSYRVTSGSITDADIVINRAHDWGIVAESDGSCDQVYDLENVLTHEMGHLFGMGHSDEPEASMFSTAPRCEIRKRYLSADDIAGVEGLYQDVDMTSEEEISAACQSTSPAGFGTFLLIIAALFASSRFGGRLRRLGLLGIALSGILPHHAASATTLRQMNVEELAVRADVVVEGVVMGQQSLWHDGRIYTDSLIRMTECWAGACQGEGEFVVRQVGGEVGEFGMVVAGVAVLPLHGTVVLFVRKRDQGPVRILGMAQGVFHLSGEKGLVVRDLSGLQLMDAQRHVHSGKREAHSRSQLRLLVSEIRTRD